jgi:hypothetical protein
MSGSGFRTVRTRASVGRTVVPATVTRGRGRDVCARVERGGGDVRVRPA